VRRARRIKHVLTRLWLVRSLKWSQNPRDNGDRVIRKAVCCTQTRRYGNSLGFLEEVWLCWVSSTGHRLWRIGPRGTGGIVYNVRLQRRCNRKAFLEPKGVSCFQDAS
jgi:hypothetical protein